ncbi:MAG TPA: RHS repeat-associated core domain-containing protein, partial [Micromonosporaceae bacterium]
SQTHHTAGGNQTTSYAYPLPNQNQPHTLTSTSGASTGSYTYDQSGNTLTRPGNTSQQTLTWDAEGHLATLTEGASTSTFVYDVDGARLITRDATGATLHLAAGTEIHVDTGGGNASATRRYAHAGQTIATRTNTDGLSWLFADHQTSATLSVRDSDNAVTHRRQTPYGTPRGSTPSWPDKHGYVNGFNDASGLVHIGAREYDDKAGRFVSIDPIIDTNDPQQMHGYSYSTNSPVTMSDPDGLRPVCGDGGDERACRNDELPKPTRRSTYDEAKRRYFDLASEPQGSLRIYKGGAGLPDRLAPGNGIVVIRVFISPADAGFGFKGDGRSFSTDPNAGFRVAIAWNTDTGELTYEATKSCYNDGECGSQTWNDSVVFEASKTGDNSFKFTYGGRDALAPWAPAVNGEVEIAFTDEGVRVKADRDAFPHFEVIQYRQDTDPRFLATDIAWGGPQAMFPIAPNAGGEWLNGAWVSHVPVRDVGR